jgi:hypothetical protein
MMEAERRDPPIVIPAQAGIPAKKSRCQMSWDPGLRRGDGLWGPS